MLHRGLAHSVRKGVVGNAVPEQGQIHGGSFYILTKENSSTIHRKIKGRPLVKQLHGSYTHKGPACGAMFCCCLFEILHPHNPHVVQ